jgi:hypothetical protein
MAVAGVGVFVVAADGGAILLTEVEADVAPRLQAETALGPPLVLALALQGTWCLHGSAVLSGQHVIAFAGESGNGKSTLAAFVGSGARDGRRRIVDDILPAEPRLEGLEALPHFPQLKLPPDQQPSIGLPKRLPLAALYVLDEPGADDSAVDIQPLTPREAMLTLIRHTVAARLFGKDLLERHMAFCAGAAVRVPVRRVTYPRQFRALPVVRDALAADLETLQLI